MNEIELQRLYEAQLTAQTRNERIPAQDRNAAAAMLNVSERLMGTRLNPSEEYRTWVFSDPHFGHEASVAIFGRPFRNRHHGDGYLLDQWTHGVRDRDTVVCLGDVTMDRPTDGLIDRLRRRPGRKILVAGNHDNAHIRRLRRAFDAVAAGRIPDFPVTRSHPPASWPSAANSSICRTYRKTAGEESRRRSPVANRWMRP